LAAARFDAALFQKIITKTSARGNAPETAGNEGGRTGLARLKKYRAKGTMVQQKGGRGILRCT